MKIFYIANSRIPTEKAHGRQIMKTCEAFAKLGNQVELILPSRKNKEFENFNPFDFYGVAKNFKITFLAVADYNFLSKLKMGFYFKLQTKLFEGKLKQVVKSMADQDIIYTRENLLLSFLINSGKKVVWEVHDLPNSFNKYKDIWNRCYKVVVISEGLKKELIDSGVTPGKILVSPDGVDLQMFASNITQQQARQELGIGLDKKIVLYSGHLYSWKGADILAQAAKELADAEVMFIGGTNEDIKRFKNNFSNQKNVTILGSKSYEQVPLYLKAADVLILPNSGKQKISANYTSPLKMFEYMAANRPIVASALPSLKEVLNDKNCVFAKADDPQDLANKIKKVLADNSLAKNISQQAFSDVQKYTWDKRAEKIINFI